MSLQLKGLTLAVAVVVVGLSACERSGPLDPTSEVVGEYTLRLHQDHPLPFFDYRSQVSVQAGTLHLHANGTFTRTITVFSTWSTQVDGTFTLSGDTVVLMSNGTELERYRYDDGVLKSDAMVFVRADAEIPHEYRYDLYRLHRCDGQEVSFQTPCSRPGEFHIHGSRLWLWESGRLDLSHDAVGSTIRRTGSYTRSGTTGIVLSGAGEIPSSGTLQGDSLVLNGLVYRLSQP
jgi:hypothetical protein